MLRYFTPVPAIDGAFFDVLAAKKLSKGLGTVNVQLAFAQWGVDVAGHHALRLTKESLVSGAGEIPNAILDVNANAPSVTWGWVFSLNSREELTTTAVPALERLTAAAAAGAAAGSLDAPSFILAAVSDHKSRTTSYRLCLPALIVVGDLNAVTQPRDAAGACLVMLAAADDTFVGKPPGAALRIADGLGANARPPPAPLGWPARGALTRAAAAVAEPAVLTVLLERPPAPPLEAAVAVDFPHSAAVLLHAPNAPWRELLRRVRVEGLTAAVELDFQLPLPLTSPPLGTIHHGASHGPDESDSASLARTSVRLHLELMKWRACPAFDIDKVVALRVLIIGAGAVGGAISCTLLGYGVTKQTFVDSGTVGLSNVARQPLFSAADAAHGMAKATAAANSLVASHPGAEAIGIVLDIPTPGRAQRGTDAITAHLSAIATLRELLKTSDVVFLALDTREARWLPAVMAASLPPACAPLVITAGVGFDTAVVVRHGAPHSTLGCFFCAGGDTAPPRDSRAGAPMDEICTVTRPGVVFLVGALAAELAITTLLHPLGAAAPHEAMDAVVFPSPFGAASHVTRAKIRGPSITTTGAPADPFCLTCGPTIQNEIALRGDAFLIDALTYPKTLEMLYSRRDAVDARMTHTDSATLEGGWNAL